MRTNNRRGVAIFFLVFGICLVALAIALQVGWIFFSLERIVVLVFGIIFFALIITGLILNTIFLIREIRRNEQHNAFINSVTHELKTPVASIRLYLETLKARDLSEEKRQEFYRIMLSDTDRLHNTIEQVLQAGRIGNRPPKRTKAEIHLPELLDNSIAVVRSRYNLEQKNFEFNERGSASISGDSQELQTVFVNLLDNAVKYSKEEVKVQIAVKDKGEKLIAVEIKDSGIGMPKSELKRIFNRFYRVPGAIVQRVKGTGLGLYIVQSIVKKHGGKIFAASHGENKGSTFTVELRKS